MTGKRIRPAVPPKVPMLPVEHVVARRTELGGMTRDEVLALYGALPGRAAIARTTRLDFRVLIDLIIWAEAFPDRYAIEGRT